MKQIVFTLMLALTLSGWGAESKLAKGLSEELSYAKAKGQKAVMVAVLAMNHPSYGGLSKRVKSDVLDSKELKEFLTKAKVEVVTFEDFRIVRNDRYVNRLFWNWGNLVGIVLVDTNGKVLNKLTAFEILGMANGQPRLKGKEAMSGNDLIELYKPLLEIEPEKSK